MRGDGKTIKVAQDERKQGVEPTSTSIHLQPHIYPFFPDSVSPLRYGVVTSLDAKCLNEK